ncbi:39S ribosomal protein L21, mitochondrial-like [Gigantopelta aegis]|uniref:39S ribosomal protein L21, mitochondrial-like n=1 Tax=Gigantopelta aegis TaxID=1735272 RepID=UPI001B888927|nr:39S ribosomal protein L21, mitochondrial-like [Gigantopelta aegis]
MAVTFTFGRFCSHVLKISSSRATLSGLHRCTRHAHFSTLKTEGVVPVMKLLSSTPGHNLSSTEKLPTCINCFHPVRNASSLPSQRPSHSEEDWSVLTNPSQSTALTEKVNSALQSEDVGRLFAVVHIAGKQRKITTEDMILIQHYFPPNIGDRIRLEKVLMVGSKDFSLVGQPLLSRDVVRVEATVVEKTLSYYKTKFNYVRRKGFRRFNLIRSKYTMLVINSIEMNSLP